jgi:hypothetical protein
VQIEHKPKNGPNQRSHGTARSAPPVNRDVGDLREHERMRITQDDK